MFYNLCCEPKDLAHPVGGWMRSWRHPAIIEVIFRGTAQSETGSSQVRAQSRSGDWQALRDRRAPRNRWRDHRSGATGPLRSGRAPHRGSPAGRDGLHPGALPPVQPPVRSVRSPDRSFEVRPARAAQRVRLMPRLHRRR